MHIDRNPRSALLPVRVPIKLRWGPEVGGGERVGEMEGAVSGVSGWERWRARQAAWGGRGASPRNQASDSCRLGLPRT